MVGTDFCVYIDDSYYDLSCIITACLVQDTFLEPEDGILLRLLWSLVVDELLAGFNESSFYAGGLGGKRCH
jgi:hypothetical protein